MKMKPKHYKHMEHIIKMFIMANHVNCELHKASYNPKRYAWDICHAAGLTPFICDTLYKYLNDSHIETALLKITK